VFDFMGSISKQKIPNNYSYVLKTGQLKKLLVDNNIRIHIDLNYCLAFNIEQDSIFEAHYWFPNENIPYDRVYIRAGALPKENILNAREKLEKKVLPEFAVWIKNILSLPDNSTLLKHDLRFHAIFHTNDVFINLH